MISPLAYVDPSAKIGKNVTIHPFAYIEKNVEIGDDNVIMPYASLLSGTRMGKGNIVYQGAVVASIPQDYNFTGEDTLMIIGDNNVIRENAVLTRGTHPDHATKVGDKNFIMQSVRLSHDAEIGSNCIIGNGTLISGNCIIHDCAILCSHVLMQMNTRVGRFALVQGGCRFNKDIPPFIVAAHEPTVFHSINKLVLENEHFSEKTIKELAYAYRLIYKTHTSLFNALLRIEEQIPPTLEIKQVVEFCRSSQLGII